MNGALIIWPPDLGSETCDHFTAASIQKLGATDSAALAAPPRSTKRRGPSILAFSAAGILNRNPTVSEIPNRVRVLRFRSNRFSLDRLCASNAGPAGRRSAHPKDNLGAGTDGPRYRLLYVVELSQQRRCRRWSWLVACIELNAALGDF
jgi:hypothetical protein